MFVNLFHAILLVRIPKEEQIMNNKFYKMKRNSMVSGVLAGLSDKWNFDVTLVRFLFAIFTISNFGIGVIIYIILASILPTKEEIEAEMYEQDHANARKPKPLKTMMDGFGEVN